MKRVSCLSLFFFIFLAPVSQAEFRQIDLSIFGMD